MKPSATRIQNNLLKWFDQHGRKSLPWQINKTPYRVWISEIMLQQTQVSTVMPYFERFMNEFPDVKTLAAAHEDRVLHHWAGLGYYSRARNLHLAAKTVIDEYKGKFPNTLEGLKTLPGIGPSTAGAIMAIAYEQQAPILDGNVKRVLSRLHGITPPINDKDTEETLWQLAVRYTPKSRVADYTQAIMDLGATLCTRSKPDCPHCPFNKQCIAYAENLTAVIPAKKVTQKIPTRTATFLVIKKDQNILIQKRPATGIWGGLFSLPELAGIPDNKTIKAFCQQSLGLAVKPLKPLTAFRHTFSHYHLQIHPILLEIKQTTARVMEDNSQIWYNLDKPAHVGLPKPIHTILRELT